MSSTPTSPAILRLRPSDVNMFNARRNAEANRDMTGILPISPTPMQRFLGVTDTSASTADCIPTTKIGAQERNTKRKKVYHYPKVIVEGKHSHHFKRELYDYGTRRFRTHWSCDDRKCEGELTSLANRSLAGFIAQYNFKMLRNHSEGCTVTADKIIKKQKQNEMSDLMRETGMPAVEAYRKVVVDAIKTDVHAARTLPPYISVKSNLSRVRQEDKPEEITIVNFDVIPIPLPWCRTEESDPSEQRIIVLGRASQLVKLKDGTTTKRGFIAFGHPDLFAAMLLTSFKVLVADGTFKVVPKPFAQVFNIGHFEVAHGVRKMFIGTHVAMTDRTTECYNMVFHWLGEEMLKLKGKHAYGIWNLQPMIHFMCDFEPAMRKAVEETLSKYINVTVRGCFFHWCQCIWRDVQLQGLAQLYKRSRLFRDFCDSQKVLPFVPEYDVADVYSMLTDHFLALFTDDEECRPLMWAIQRHIDYVTHFTNTKTTQTKQALGYER